MLCRAAKVKRMSYKNGSFTCKKLKSASSYSGSEKKKARKLLFHISHYVFILFGFSHRKATLVLIFCKKIGNNQPSVDVVKCCPI